MKKIFLFFVFIFVSQNEHVTALEVWMKGEEHPDQVISSFDELAKADKKTREKIVSINVYGENNFFTKRNAGYPGYILTLAPNVETLEFDYVFFIPKEGAFYSKGGTADLSFLSRLKKLKKLTIKGGCEDKYVYGYKAFKNRTNLFDHIDHISEEISIDEMTIERPGWFDKIIATIGDFFKKIAHAVGIHSTVKKMLTKAVTFDQENPNHIKPSAENPIPDDTGVLIFKNYILDKENVDGIVQALPAMENDKITKIEFHDCTGEASARLLRMLVELKSTKINNYSGEIGGLSELVPVLMRHKNIEKITFENCASGIYQEDKDALFRAGIDVTLINTHVVTRVAGDDM